MNIFITGVSGFVGSGLVEALLGHKNISIFGHGRDEGMLKKKFEGQSIKVVNSYSAELFDQLGIDCVIHLAGIAHDLSNKFQSVDYHTVNTDGTKAIYNEFIRSRASKFIFLSSIKACIDSSDAAVDESVHPKPFSDYGKSKLLAEEFIQQTLAADKSYYIFRPCMIHGKGNKGNLNLLYKYVKSGLPYIFGAYTNNRSFLTADNLNFIILTFLNNRFQSGVYHVADDGTLSTVDLVKIISISLGRKARVWNISSSFLDIASWAGALIGLPSERMKNKLTESLVVSTAKLKKEMGVDLPVPIQQGILNTLKYF